MNNNKIISIDRKGYAAHYWIGPFGIHLFRYKGDAAITPWSKWMPKWFPYILRISPIWFDYDANWREVIE